MIALNFTVGRTTMSFLVLLLATVVWANGVHENENHGHVGHENGVKNHGIDPTRNYDEDTKSSVDVNKESILKTEKKKEKIDPNSTNKPPPPIDFGRLDLRVGHIINATKHPNDGNLYVEYVNVGEDNGPRTIVSGLENYIPLEKMAGRTVIVLCNLKPHKLVGILSEGMVMCAYDGKTAEILQPPPSILPGDVVVLEDRRERNPDKVLDSIVFEEIAKDLKTDANLQATYKGIPWLVQDWRYAKYIIGPVTVQTLRNCNIY